jgi:hypothetical protein
VLHLENTDGVRNDEVLHTVKEKGIFYVQYKKERLIRLFHILCRKCFLKDVIEGQVEGGM